MASFGLLGAIGGAAQGAGQALQSQLEQDRKLRLEELRTSNTRETNRMSNEQRFDFSLRVEKERDALARGRQKDQNQWEINNQDGRTDYGKRIDELREFLPDASDQELVDIAYGRKAPGESGASIASGSIKPWVEPLIGPDGSLVTDEMGEPVMREVGYQWLGSDGTPQRSRYGEPGNQAAGQAQGGAAPAEPGDPSKAGAVGIPQSALDFLEKNKGNPDIVRQFEEKYGRLPDGHEALGPAEATDPASSIPSDSVPAQPPQPKAKKYGASLDSAFGVPARAVAEASKNMASSAYGSIRESMDKAGARAEYQKYKGYGYSEDAMPTAVLESMLPYLKGEEAERVAKILASRKQAAVSHQ